MRMRGSCMPFLSSINICLNLNHHHHQPGARRTTERVARLFFERNSTVVVYEID